MTGRDPLRLRPMLWLRRLAASALALGLAALATDPAAAQPDASPRAACLAAVRDAEARHGLPQGLLVAVALAESGLHANAVNIGGVAHYPARAEDARRLLAAAPGEASLMVGCVQVNARVHPRSAEWALDPSRAADWAARYLLRHHAEFGDWVAAVSRWNGGTAQQRQRLVCRVAAILAEIAPDTDAMRGASCSPTELARAARDGRALMDRAIGS
ncbi:MAG: transglycosylase SLT domain-containing protein [Acetobacteraceae bacterium]|nr:transglycosylase SLT domain-containing protein [Acetobacteraceae bacterium]